MGVLKFFVGRKMMNLVFEVFVHSWRIGLLSRRDAFGWRCLLYL